jgi:hypothetical protein
VGYFGKAVRSGQAGETGLPAQKLAQGEAPTNLDL